MSKQRKGWTETSPSRRFCSANYAISTLETCSAEPARSSYAVETMIRPGILLCLVGCLIAASMMPAATAQFGQRVLYSAASEVVPTSSAQSRQQGQPFSIQAGIQLPRCPNLRILSNAGVPEQWAEMTVEQQVADPINAVMLQLAYVAWQDDPKATLSKCLDNLGVDLESVSTVHRVVLPYLGTMSAVVMRAGDKGVFVALRGTDFEDAGDVLVDADCQHTDDKRKNFGSSRSIHLHTGFYRAWESVAPTVISLVWKQLQQTKTKKVYLVGHSLGGAMAAVGALRLNYLLSATGAEVGGVWLFGCPRIGNQAWMEEYNQHLLTKTLRMANYGDFPSRLPMETQVCVRGSRLLQTFDFRHVGRALVLCPDAQTGLTDWHMYANGSESLDCGRRADRPDMTLSTHWLGPYLDAWRRAHAAVFDHHLASDPCITSVVCDECSLSFPGDRAKQLNVPARAGGPVGCCTSASCSQQSAWDAVAIIGAQVSRTFNSGSVCQGFICT